MDEETHKTWKEGNREQLSLALCTALKKVGFGTEKSTREAVRVGG